MGETVSERVRWATGSFTGVDGLGEDTVGGAVGAVVGDGSTLGGGTTFRGGTNLGGGTTLGGGNNVGGDGVVGSLTGGARAVVVVHLLKRLWSLDTSNSCSWWTVVAVYLTAQDRILRAWTILSLGVTYDWVRYLWSTLIVLDTMMGFAVASTTWKKR